MKKILFLTGTRADFGKIKPLINVLEEDEEFEVFIFVTGMHLQLEYGYTFLEIERCGFSNLYTFQNHTQETTMDLTLAKTIEGLSTYVKLKEPDLIVVHGDRVETLAGAIVGSLNNVLVAHIEGGEVSGTIDELIRHSVSKLSHLHFVSNGQAKKRLMQMGEVEGSIFVIGSPDLDIMFSESLPSINAVKIYYEIPFTDYGIAMFHPVTTEASTMSINARTFVDALIQDVHNYVIIYPNNDLGSSDILKEYERLRKNSRFRIIPSLRFEYFLSLLKNTNFIIGNSSAGIREAPYYGVPVINVGTRQLNRTTSTEILNVDYSMEGIKGALNKIKSWHKRQNPISENFGNGNSSQLFKEILKQDNIWNINHQKQFRDI